MNRIYLILFLILISGSYQAAFAIDVMVTARVPGCGDNIVDVNEQCDGNPVLHNTCSNLGYSTGNISCTNACNYDASSCSILSPSVLQGGSFSPINYIKNNKLVPSFLSKDNKKINLADNSVIFEGITKPDTEVVLLDNNNIIAKTKSDIKGKYSLSVSNVSRKNNIFTLTSGIESKRFIVNMYSDNIIKYNDVTLGSAIKFKIDAIINEYEIKMNVDFTDFQSKVIL